MLNDIRGCHQPVPNYGKLQCVRVGSSIVTNVGCPGGTVIKNPPANEGDTGSSPGLGRSHMPRSN